MSLSFEIGVMNWHAHLLRNEIKKLKTGSELELVSYQKQEEFLTKHFQGLLTELEEKWTKDKKEKERLTDNLTDLQNDLQASANVIRGWEKIDQAKTKSLTELTHKITEANTQLSTLYTAIEGDQLGKPKEAKKLILNYLKTIQNSLISERERERESK